MSTPTLSNPTDLTRDTLLPTEATDTFDPISDSLLQSKMTIAEYLSKHYDVSKMKDTLIPKTQQLTTWSNANFKFEASTDSEGKCKPSLTRLNRAQTGLAHSATTQNLARTKGGLKTILVIQMRPAVKPTNEQGDEPSEFDGLVRPVLEFSAGKTEKHPHATSLDAAKAETKEELGLHPDLPEVTAFYRLWGLRGANGNEAYSAKDPGCSGNLDAPYIFGWDMPDFELTADSFPNFPSKNELSQKMQRIVVDYESLPELVSYCASNGIIIDAAVAHHVQALETVKLAGLGRDGTSLAPKEWATDPLLAEAAPAA